MADGSPSFKNPGYFCTKDVFATDPIDFNLSNAEAYKDLTLDYSYLRRNQSGLGEDAPSLTGRGLRIRLLLLRCVDTMPKSMRQKTPEVYFAYINCKLGEKSLCIAIRREHPESLVFERVECRRSLQAGIGLPFLAWTFLSRSSSQQPYI